MQGRAYNHWAELRGAQSLPSIKTLNPDDFPDLAPFGVLLDLSGGAENPVIVLLGSRLAEECSPNLPLRARSDVPPGSLLARITERCREIVVTQTPIAFAAELTKEASRKVQYRGILLPFSSNNQTIDFIYGVINWKELADPATTSQLVREIEQALRANVPGRTGAAMSL